MTCLSSKIMPLILLFHSSLVVLARKEDFPRIMHGRYTNNLKDYQLLVPEKVNYDGSFLTYSLPNFFQHNYESKRRKRDFSHPDVVHYKIYFNGEDHHIDLWPNHGFVSPSAITEYQFQQSDESVQPVEARKMKSLAPIMCHYTGNMRDAVGSSVALSACNSLTGFIKTSNGTYFIEPVKDYGPNEEGHLLHIIHKQAASRQNPKFCGTSNWEEGWRKSFQYIQGSANPSEIEKRSVTNSEHHYLEVLVAVDRKFMDFHKNDDYENYILTVMNMVSDYFHDSSAGNQIDVVVVRIVYLEQEMTTFDLDVTPDAEKSLKSFCKWQQEVNPKSLDHPQHHDIAVLLTRHDLCTKENCDLLGLANVAAACLPSDSCAITEDNGLILGVVLAHEIGHIMGCHHDDKNDSGCAEKENDNFFHVMAPSVNLATTKWSKCSKTYMNELFESKLGECLIDEPKVSQYKMDEMLPGSIYDGNFQCRLLFNTTKQCHVSENKACEKLYCEIHKGGKKICRTNGDPPADGTSCGGDKWCYKKECVRKGVRPKSTPGGWGPWSELSNCSRSCGGGIQVSERECNSPVPQNGGRYCLGERKKINICHIKECPPGTQSFLAEQCSEHNEIPFNGNLHKWEPMYLHSKNCALVCKNEKHTYSVLAPRAKDGTPCKPGSNYLCLSGQCMKVGCDWRLDSNSVEDHCGICNGDGSGCRLVNETYIDSGQDMQKVIVIPNNARRIFVKELTPSDNSIVIIDPRSQKIILDGKNAKDGEINLAGNLALFEHPEPKKEELFIKGPLTHSLQLSIKYKSSYNVRFLYQFAILNSQGEATLLKDVQSFNWQFLEFEKCSKRCGGGKCVANAVCVKEGKEGQVSDEFCDGNKPQAKVKACNKKECQISWHTSEWGECNGCKHNPGAQSRKVWCAHESSSWEENPVVTSEDKCNIADGPKPSIKQLCVGKCGTKCDDRPKRDADQDKFEYWKFYKKLSNFFEEPEIIFFGNVKIKADQDLYDESADDFIEVEEQDQDQNEKEPLTYTFCNEEDNLDKLIKKAGNKQANRPLKEILILRDPLINDLLIKSPNSNKYRYERMVRSDYKPEIDKEPNDHQIIEDVPEEIQKLDRLSDEAFEKYGDKVETPLDFHHAQVFKGQAAHEMLEKEHTRKHKKYSLASRT